VLHSREKIILQKITEKKKIKLLKGKNNSTLLEGKLLYWGEITERKK
jgi:hypothetical protein